MRNDQYLNRQVGAQIDKVFSFQLETNNTTPNPMVRVFPSRDELKKNFLKHLDLHHAINEDNLYIFVILPNDETGWYAFRATKTQIVIKQWGRPTIAYVNSECLRVDLLDENERIKQICKGEEQ